MRGAPGNWVGAELALARRKRAQTAATRGTRPPRPRPPGDPSSESPLEPRQSAGGKERGLQTSRRPGSGERGGKGSTGCARGSRTGRPNIPGGPFLLPKQNHLEVFPEKPVPAPEAPRLQETRPNPFTALARGVNGFIGKKFALLCNICLYSSRRGAGASPPQSWGSPKGAPRQEKKKRALWGT